MLRFLQHAAAAVISAFAALFGVFNILFSDIFGVGQRLQSYLSLFLFYAVAVTIMSGLWPAQRRAWLWWFGVPAVAVASFVAMLEAGQLLTALGAAAFALLGAWLGTLLGARLHSARPQRPQS